MTRKVPSRVSVGERRVDDKYRVSIPKETLGVEHGDEVDALFGIPGARGRFEVKGLEVQHGGRVTIPNYRRRRYGIESGDTVEVTVVLGP